MPCVLSPASLQGELGNCWFLSALASLAERPELIRRLIINTGDGVAADPHGTYYVRICFNGSWTTVLIDDLLPCIGGRLAFCHSASRELWVPLLEKAYAKGVSVFGCDLHSIAHAVCLMCWQRTAVTLIWRPA